MKFVINAGGQGTKLWPLSRESRPKHFQPIFPDNTSTYQYSINILLRAFPVADIFISTKKQYVKMAQEQCPQIPLENYFIEPDARRGRGPAEGYVFIKLLEKFPTEPFMLVQGDDLRRPEEAFLSMIKEMETIVKRDKLFITGGNKATYPMLGVDYLQLGEKIESSTSLELYKIEKFVPRLKDYEKTKELIEDFHMVIHCNHTCWYPDLILNDYKKYAPDWYEALMKIKATFGTENEEEKTKEIYEGMRFGMTEEVIQYSMATGYSVLLPYKWLDIGTWDSVYEIFGTSPENLTEIGDGKALVLEGGGNVIKSTSKGKLIALYGLSDLAVVDTPDALLVMPRSKAEKIKDILEELKGSDGAKYL